MAEAERLHERQQIRRECGLLPGTRRIVAAKPGRPVAAQIRHDDPRAGIGQTRGDRVISMNVVGKPVQQHDRPTVRVAMLGIADVQNAGIDVSEHDEPLFRDRADRNRLACGEHRSHRTSA
jgi:hypothetical protein